MTCVTFEKFAGYPTPSQLPVNFIHKMGPIDLGTHQGHQEASKANFLGVFSHYKILGFYYLIIEVKYIRGGKLSLMFSVILLQYSALTLAMVIVFKLMLKDS